MRSLARALAVSPRLVIVDEMSLGLAPQVVDAVFLALEKAKSQGVSVLLIEQFVDRALQLADYCYILRRGEVSWQGTPMEIGSSVLEMYLGSDPEKTEDVP
jgi:branched-chain amino acid transport system ATP-binding protein